MYNDDDIIMTKNNARVIYIYIYIDIRLFTRLICRLGYVG